MQASLGPIVEGKGFAPDAWTTTWKYTATAGANPMGVEWYGILAGLGFVLSFGYWCTNFLIVQRAMAAESMTAARKVPLIGAIPKMFIPFLIIIPGVAALVLLNDPLKGFALPVNDAGQPIYDYTIIMLLKQYLPAGVLGLGITALLALSCQAWQAMYRHSTQSGPMISTRVTSGLPQVTTMPTKTITLKWGGSLR